MEKVKKANDLFGKINIYPPKHGKKRVEIYIRLDQRVENMRAGIAIDGSASMMSLFAANIPKLFRQPGANIMEPVVRHLSCYICDYSSDGTVELLYWALGSGGKRIQPLGVFSSEQCRQIPVEGPTKYVWGTGTKLLPALDYFLSQFQDAEWTIILFITDGALEDFEAVKSRAMEVAQEIVNGSRKACKFIMIGIGDADEEQLQELDDMFDGTDLGEIHGIDLWDCKMANDMNELHDIWDEVDFNITLPGSARIFDSKHKLLQSYADGIPQRMEFDVVETETSVIIEMAGQTFAQPLV